MFRTKCWQLLEVNKETLEYNDDDRFSITLQIVLIIVYFVEITNKYRESQIKVC